MNAHTIFYVALLVCALAQAACGFDPANAEASTAPCKLVDTQAGALQLCAMPNGDRCYISQAGSVSCLAPKPGNNKSATNDEPEPEVLLSEGDILRQPGETR